MSRSKEFLSLLEDDKLRLQQNLNPNVFAKISDAKRKEYYSKARNAPSEFYQIYWSNRALGYTRKISWNMATDAMEKENKQSSEHDVFHSGSEDDKESGFATVGDTTKQVAKEAEQKDMVLDLIKSVKSRFKDNPDAEKIVSLYLINAGFDEMLPHGQIPFYKEVSSVVSKLAKEREDKKRKHENPVIDTLKSLGIPTTIYYKVIDHLKYKLAKVANESLRESFLSGLKSLFSVGDSPVGSKGKTFKLSNLEPMETVLRRDMDQNKHKYYGLHLQGVTKEEGEDMIKDSQLLNIKHQFQGDVLIIPLEAKTNIQRVLKKALPGKRVILFGYDKTPKALRKGWEGFPYKIVSNPTVLGSYSLSPETKAESLMNILEGFQCDNYVHKSMDCGLGRACPYKGFPSMKDENMKMECMDYK